MSEEEKKPKMAEEETPKEPIVYASPLKRIWAWVGVVYMVIITFLIVYMLAFGAYLRGIGGIMVCPAIGGAAVSLFYMWQQGQGHSTVQRVLFSLTIGLCAALIILGLWTGIPALIANFGVK